MTNHPEVGELQAYLDGEGAYERREAIDRHLGHCAGCGQEIADLRTAAVVTSGGLALLDPQTPDLGAVRWRVRRAHAASRTRGFRRAASIAASIMVVGAAGWAAAAPGSPLRSLWRAEPSVGSAPVLAAPPAVTSPPTVTVGLPAGAATVSITFARVADSAQVLVIDADSADPASVTAPETSAFSTADGRITADVGFAPGPLVVSLPSATDAEILVNGQAILVRTAGQDAFPGPEPERTGEGLSFTVEGM